MKDVPNYPEKLLIDVREPGELVADGKIPFSINIPCEFISPTRSSVTPQNPIISAKTVEESLKLSPEVFYNKFGVDRPTTDTEMIFHCKGGGRGGRATELALSLGFVK